MRYRRHLLLLAILAVFVAACGGAEQPTQSASPAAGGGGISTANTDLGTVLVDAQGKTLYGFTDDADASSTCFDACADTWPPVPGDVSPGPNLDASVFTTTQREDGTTQLVAGDWPLYTYSGDQAAGDVNGQGSGGVWFAVAPDGTLIKGAGASEAASPAAAATPPEGIEQPVLTNSQGLTLYYFRNDEPGSSACNEPCSDTWPPVPANEQIDASGLDPSALGPITRDDGTEQLAFNGQPLYTFIDDVNPGDVNGQGVGDVWFAVALDGSEVGPEGLRIGSTDAGDVLIDADGFTLYTFDNDSEGTSTCNDPCQETWPPVPAETAIDTSSVKEEQFAAITRQDGSEQLALNGQPLYRFKDDVNPGDANGDGVGDVWFAVPADDVDVAEAGGGDAGAQADDSGGGAAGVTVGETDLGPTLVDAEGKTLYALTDDTPGTSTCNDACADTWPPVPGDVAVDESAVTGETTSITRDDGSSQLQIGKWPLYTFSGDEAPGDINGQGSGGIWFAVAPDGSLYQ
jgi:predicted lipoprotein with Yx(FWY)xxD motif